MIIKLMEDSGLIQQLENIKNARRVYRDGAAGFVLDNPEVMPELMKCVFRVDSPLHVKAAWVLELVCLQNISLLYPHVPYFIKHLSSLKNESALRPVSKVCYLMNRAYFSSGKKAPDLSLSLIDLIIVNNFDWLLQGHKVATQVFAMDTLNLWSDELPWVREALVSILEKNMNSGSSGYRSHALKLLKNL